MPAIDSPRAAARFVLLMGVVSLFADMTYEGGRSITGPYLAVLGAGGAAVGIVSGLGELLGYALRLLTGRLADRTGRYWGLTILGYAVNLLAVPCLALAGSWEAAAALILLERLGKAIRTPARDVLLARATRQIGHGWGFGLHEALDQIGAVSGPLIVTATLYTLGGERHRAAFAVLLVPALMALAVLTGLWARWREPAAPHAAHPAPEDGQGPWPRDFRLYLLATAAIAAGTLDFPLMAYHFEKAGVLSPGSIPLLYAMAMAVDAVAALVFGRLFDRRGLPVLAWAVALAAPSSWLAFGTQPALAIFGVALWGIGLGAQESIVRAAVATMVPEARRGAAYGTFQAAYGASWFLGSALMGIFYDQWRVALIGSSITCHLLALLLLARLSTAPPEAH